jgi:uncharacterized repeat protein (TIGR03847 family)
VLIELDPVDRITADAVGPPGQRVFYLQGRSGERLVTLLVEKQQVQLLAASVVEILSRVGKETGQGPPEEAMGLEEPILPEWRAGRLSIGYQEERDLLVLEAEELLPEDEEGEEGEDEEEDQGGLSEEPGPGIAGLRVPPLGPEAAEEEPDGDEGDEAAPPVGDRSSIDEGTFPGGGPDDGEDEQPEAARVRFWATREQMLSMARHGAAVCAQGRPRCQLCGAPIEEEGHRCPALNGHREMGEG